LGTRFVWYLDSNLEKISFARSSHLPRLKIGAWLGKAFVGPSILACPKAKICNARPRTWLARPIEIFWELVSGITRNEFPKGLAPLDQVTCPDRKSGLAWEPALGKPVLACLKPKFGLAKAGPGLHRRLKYFGNSVCLVSGFSSKKD
jgi:hypothetical protein